MIGLFVFYYKKWYFKMLDFSKTVEYTVDGL